MVLTDTTVPIFSLVDLQNGLHKTELQKCLLEKGIFLLKDSGIPDKEHELVFSTTLDFFQEGSDQTKASLVTNISGIRRGYSKLDSESTAQVTDKGTYSDYASCYSMGLDDNMFPSKEFEDVYVKYFGGLYSAAKATAKVVLEAVEANCNEPVDSFLECDPVLRVRHYPDVPEERCAEFEPLRMAPHYDLSIITLVHQTPSPNGFVSLQYDVGGIFVDVPPIPNTLVVLCGAVAPLVSNGKIKAATHQVLAPSSKYRIGSHRNSTTFFLRPRQDFTFSVPHGRSCGLKISLNGETATFKDWMRGNYTNMHTNLPNS